MSTDHYTYIRIYTITQVTKTKSSMRGHGMAPPRSTPIIFACCVILLSFLAGAFITSTAAVAAGEETCVPSLQRLLSCLDFIEHRSEEIPAPCCVQVRRTVAEQPCCLMHVVRGNAGRLIGPEFDSTRAMVNVTTNCLGGDASVLMSITRNCSGKPLPPLTPEFTFTTAAVPPPPPSSSGATMWAGSSAWTSLLLGIAATVVYGAVHVLQI